MTSLIVASVRDFAREGDRIARRKAQDLSAKRGMPDLIFGGGACKARDVVVCAPQGSQIVRKARKDAGGFDLDLVSIAPDPKYGIWRTNERAMRVTRRCHSRCPSNNKILL